MSDRTERINLIATDTRNPDFTELPSAVIEVMIHEAEANQSNISLNIEELGKKQFEAKKHGNLRGMENLGHEILTLRDKLNKIKDRLPVLEESLRCRRLDERVMERLGSERNVVILDYIILSLTVATLLIICLEIFFNLSGLAVHILNIIDTIICLAFLCEFFWRMELADSRWWFFKRNWILFIASLPLAGLLYLPGVSRFVEVLQFGQGVRLVRMTRLIRSLRLLRSFTYFSRNLDKLGLPGAQIVKQPFIRGLLSVFLGQFLTGNQVKKIIRPLLFSLLTIFIGGFLIAYFDGQYDPNVMGTGQGAWWCFTTVITKDFANIYNPQHLPGRIVTAIIILIGMLLSGALIGNLTDAFMEDRTDRIERKQAILQRHLDEITEKIQAIDKLLQDLENNP